MFWMRDITMYIQKVSSDRQFKKNLKQITFKALKIFEITVFGV